MNLELLEKAVTNDMDKTLEPVCVAAYKLKPLPETEVIGIAMETNKKLGYELFDDLYYNRLILDFSRVARAVAINALNSK